MVGLIAMPSVNGAQIIPFPTGAFVFVLLVFHEGLFKLLSNSCYRQPDRTRHRIKGSSVPCSNLSTYVHWTLSAIHMKERRQFNGRKMAHQRLHWG